ncbi:MAG: hypothetical protein ABIN36_04180 [Ferruginibacter sp.]
MVKGKWLFFLGLTIVIGICACSKDSGYNTGGGELPTHYINFQDSAFTPQTVSEANGANFTFLNSSSQAITIVGDDTTILKSVIIGPSKSYFFKPDTIPVVPAQIFIPYHCVEHPSARGTIILNP